MGLPLKVEASVTKNCSGKVIIEFTRADSVKARTVESDQRRLRKFGIGEAEGWG